jgi:NTE family protein
MTDSQGLVLAGGGVAGIAWELGVLRGIGDADPDLLAEILRADVVVGTSAGSTVAGQITSGADVADLFDAQLRPAPSEIDVNVDMAELFARFQEAGAGAASPEEVLRRYGSIALEAHTVTEAVRREVIAARLPVHKWPDRRLMVPAVDTASGDRVVFTRDSGVDLVDAVAASCAVPGVWPPVTIDGRRYMDGGIRSGTNADLAAGCDRVLVLTPATPSAPTLGVSLTDEADALAPAVVHVVYGDDASMRAFGPNPLATGTRPASADAGRNVGRAAAEQVWRFWR